MFVVSEMIRNRVVPLIVDFTEMTLVVVVTLVLAGAELFLATRLVRKFQSESPS
jgi:hypothetical protein